MTAKDPAANVSSSTPARTPRAVLAEQEFAALVDAIEQEFGRGSASRPPLISVLVTLRQHARSPVPPAQALPELRAALDLLDDLLDGLMRARSR